MSNNTKHKILHALKYAFPYTIPILLGFAFLGIAYGLYLTNAGFPAYYTTITSALILGGSLEFICVSLMQGAFMPLSALLVSLVVQARHLFYGISMLEKYKNMGWKKPYAVFALIDETFSINYTASIPSDVDRNWFYFIVSILNHSFWILGATLGGFLGSVLPVKIEGLDFVMTAMFVVFFVDQFMKEKQHISAYIGVGASLLSLLIFGKDSFIIPTMILIVFLLTVLKTPIMRKGEYEL